MKKISKQQLLSVIDETIANTVSRYENYDLSTATCIELSVVLDEKHGDPSVEVACLNAYRASVGANFSSFGFSDHPDFMNYTTEKKHQVRLQKLKQFRDHIRCLEDK